MAATRLRTRAAGNRLSFDTHRIVCCHVEACRRQRAPRQTRPAVDCSPQRPATAGDRADRRHRGVSSRSSRGSRRARGCCSAGISGALAYLMLAWATVARADATMTRVRAQTHDQSGYVIFLLVVTAASASFVAIGFLAGEFKDLPFWPRAGHLTLSITALLLSWLLIQTLFAFHYARWYYSPRARKHDASWRPQVSGRQGAGLPRFRLLRIRRRA